jgi:pimeloyl-ACP methyl ester carboxylesterase
MAKGSFVAGVWRWTRRILFGFVGLIILGLVAGTIWEMSQRSYAHAHFKPSGKVVAIAGGRKMHIDCRGQGSPTVLFESGLDTNGVLAWSAVHDQVASFTRACAYDRAGVMWSDEKSTAHDGEGVARDLHALLNAAGEKGPFVMVGHSLGGPYIMNFTRLYPSYVAGVVFVDASHADQNKLMAAAGVPGLTKGIPLPLKILGRMSWSGLPRILVNYEESQSDVANPMPTAARMAAKAYIGESVKAAMEEGENLDRTLSEGGQLRTLGDRPLVVLTATKPLTPKEYGLAGLNATQYASVQRIWLQVQNDEATWSTHSRHQLVPDSTHYIQFYRPDIVIAATKEVVDQVRAGTSKAPVKPK